MNSADSTLGKLNEESLKRKERLQKLREQAAKSEVSTTHNTELAKPVFRSYKPQNEGVGEVLDQESIGDVESAVSAQLDQQPMIIDDIDIANLAPRKPDWDLKRDVAKKLERLEKRTQKAIAELIRDRLNSNQAIEDISQVVNVGTAHVGEEKKDDYEE